MPSVNGIMGEDPAYDLPEYQAENDEALAEYAKKARFSRTTEFKELKTKLESRIEYYRQYQPGPQGSSINLNDMTNDERGWRVLASSLIIEEFMAVIASYELAYETVKEEQKKRDEAAKSQAN